MTSRSGEARTAVSSISGTRGRFRLSSTGWTNYSLFLREDGLLVGYFETESFERSVAGMDERDVNTRWQADMAQYFADGQFERLEEVFHLA